MKGILPWLAIGAGRDRGRGVPGPEDRDVLPVADELLHVLHCL